MSLAVSYSYDQSGSRIIYNDVSSTTVYPNQYYNSSSTGITTKQVYAGDTLVLTVENTPPALSTRHYVHTDHLNSTSVTSDVGGLLEQLLDYYPFGAVRINQQAGSFNEQRQYIGQMYDTTTDLNYLNARYYQNLNGRFISQDPVFLSPEGSGQAIFTAFLSDPQTQNSYSYARNNPVTYSDADGKFLPLLFLAAPAIISGLEVAATAATAYFIARDAGTITGTAVSSTSSEYKNSVYNGIAENWGGGLSAASQLSPAFTGETRAVSAEQKVFRAGSYEVKLNSSVTEPYARPANATNQAMRDFAQEGKICANCGAGGKMFADHKTPLIKEYYETGAINLQNMKSTNAIQPQCATCSAQQGGYLSNISKQIKSSLSNSN